MRCGKESEVRQQNVRNGSATAGSDYQAASGTLTIPAGQTSGTITVLVNGDRLGEPNETFVVNLSAPTNATIADGQGVGTIPALSSKRSSRFDCNWDCQANRISPACPVDSWVGSLHACLPTFV